MSSDQVRQPLRVGSLDSINDALISLDSEESWHGGDFAVEAKQPLVSEEKNLGEGGTRSLLLCDGLHLVNIYAKECNLWVLLGEVGVDGGNRFAGSAWRRRRSVSSITRLASMREGRESRGMRL